MPDSGYHFWCPVKNLQRYRGSKTKLLEESGRMYSLSPAKIYILEGALKDDACAARIKRMLSAIGRKFGDAERITDEDIPEVVRSNGWRRAREYQGTLGPHEDPALVFTALRFDNGHKPDCDSLLGKCPAGTSPRLVSSMLGFGGKMVHWSEDDPDQICRSRYQFDTIYGCPHGCIYCEGGMVAVVFVNLEDFLARHVDPIVRENRWQKVFMFNSCLTDTLCFEPEYGLSELLAEYFAGTTDQYYLIHSKSANVDFLREIDHRGHTILLWSLTGDTFGPVLEPGTGTLDERILAAKKCAEAGYTIRFKFKPIVPIRGWRNECRRMIERVFAETRPDNLAMCMLAWMSFEQLKSILDPAILDPDFVRAAEESAGSLKGLMEGPFPHDSRAEVYRFYFEEIRKHDREIPVALCTETPGMWKEFKGLLGVGPRRYVCGCGPQCAPGIKTLTKIALPQKEPCL